MLMNQNSKYITHSLLYLAKQNNTLEEIKLTFTPNSESHSHCHQFMPKGWPRFVFNFDFLTLLNPLTPSFPAYWSSLPSPWPFQWGSLYLFSADNWGINSYVLGRIFTIVLQISQLKQNSDNVLLWLRLISCWLSLEDTIADTLFKRPVLLS